MSKALKDIIEDNLFFKVEFSSKYKKVKKKIEQEVKFYLIGTLPILITHQDGERERAILHTPLEVENNPYLRLLHGVKFKALKKVAKEGKKKFGANIKIDYTKEGNEVVLKAISSIQKSLKEKEFNGKAIERLDIINIQNYENNQ